MKNTRKIIVALALLLTLGLVPLAAQNSPAGALAANHVFNRDMDIFMMPNFAPFVNYQRFFSFVQGSRQAGGTGLSAGYATNLRGTLLHFFLDTDGFSLDHTATERTLGVSPTVDGLDSDRRFNLQFNTLVGTPDFGIFNFGLHFHDFGQRTAENGDDRETTRSGFFTSSITYGRNFVNDDFSMVLVGGSVRFRLPMFEHSVRETLGGGITQTTTERMRDTGDMHLMFPMLFPDTSTRLEVEPHLYWFFRPRLEPMVVISHIFLQNTLIFQFFPEETTTIQRTGYTDGWTRRERTYIGNTLFGYYNRLYVITPRFSLAWRLNFTLGFFRNFEGHTRIKEPGGNETTIRESREALYFAAVIVPRIAFSYQIIPATLTVNGALVLNELGPANAIGWQQHRITTTNDDYYTVETRIENSFNHIRPYITLGAAWYLSPHMVLESGITINTLGSTTNAVRGPGRHLNEITLAVVYRR